METEEMAHFRRSGAKKFGKISIVIVFCCFPMSVFCAVPSHCVATEKVIFNCQIKNASKIVSLCASTDLGIDSGYLQYRFGKLGNVELEYPAQKLNSQKLFQYAHYSRFQIDRTEVSFKNAGFEYSLYSYYDGEASPNSDNGVRVNQISLSCHSTVVNKLVILADILSCDKDNALASCP